ncbi:phenylacetate-CoA ligase [Reichenbachiella faecimaris]|uniref:Phenylacetate-CoA ligase n=1 Tax=Reichenbachiella faecimaris TaxID=692418 RepID=A0A1W2G6Q4_REIFA|nr:AMP-binding protein [Reichenbachiella faecimaris]SMD32194.1 phenylacetate-CoA ligase [Reichenbachiella faecimaris]
MSENNPQDFESKDVIHQLQQVEWQKHIKYIADNSSFYQELLAQNKIDSKSLWVMESLPKIPFTTKADLEAKNEQFRCVDQKQIVEYVTTSGTLGEPITLALTKQDLERLAHNEAQSLSLCGITEDDTILITTTLDKRFMAGMAYYMGATKIGAAVIRSGIGDLHFQLDNIKRYQPTTLIAVPSFALKLGQFLQDQGIDPSQTGIKKIICIGEAIRSSGLEANTLHQKIQTTWQCPLFSTYASTEMATAFTECKYGQGGHLLPELMILEIVDEHGEKVADGELGEVVATPLGVEGMPLLRYKTGDMARLHTAPCACGRITPRLGPIEGRKGQLIKLKGTSIYPQQIESALHDANYQNPYVIEATTLSIGTDHLVISVTDDTNLEALSQILTEKLRVKPELYGADVSTILAKIRAHNSRKPVRFIDLRQG